MDIRTACLEAQKEGRGITRKEFMPQAPLLIPTDTDECVIWIPYSHKDLRTPRWNPKLSDLIATDWIVFG